MLTIADLMEGLTGQRLPYLEQKLTKVVINSQETCLGSLFVALRGEHKDGHDFVAEAFGRGAIAALVEREPEAKCWKLDTRQRPFQPPPTSDFQFPVCLVVQDSLAALQRLAAYWRSRHNVRIVGVTGSMGKTTTKEIIASVLGQRFHTLKSKANYNTEIGLPLTLLRLEPPYERAVLEMGVYALGDIAQLAGIAHPQIGVVTNVRPVHLERLGTIERIAQAKSELPRALPTAADGGVAVLNGDDHRVRAMAEKTKAKVFYYGLEPSCDLWASHIESEGLEGIRFRFHYGSETIHAKVPLLGRHSVHSALASASVGLIEGLSWSEIISGLRNAAQLRLVVVAGPMGTTILDDTYNASPTSTIAAFNLLKELDGRKIAVLGDMLELGAYEEEGHRKVGRRAVDVVAKLITVGERGRIIGEEAIACGMAREDVIMIEDNQEAIDHLHQLLASGDVILVKGSRGMKMEEIVEAMTIGTSS